MSSLKIQNYPTMTPLFEKLMSIFFLNLCCKICWQALSLWRRTLRYFGWLKLTAREPAHTRTPQVCVCRRDGDPFFFFFVFFNPTFSTAGLVVNKTLNLCAHLQQWGKSASPRCFCLKRRRSLWRRLKATDRQLLRKSKDTVTLKKRVLYAYWKVDVLWYILYSQLQGQWA